MNRKQFIFVLVALCIVGGAGLLLFKRNQSTWDVREAKVGENVFPNFNPNDVAAIHIKCDKDFWVVRTNGMWRVPARYNYPANFSQISSLLMEVKQLKATQSDIVGPTLRARVDLGEPGKGPGSGTLVEFADANGKMMNSLLLGRRHDRKQNDNEPLGMRGWFDGRYVSLPTEPNNVLLVPSELPWVAEQPNGWLDTTFFKVENVKFVGMTSPDKEKNWELLRETPNSKWTMNGLNPGETLDIQKMAQATEIWAWPKFIDIISNVPPEEMGLDKPDVITVLTFDNLAYTIKVGGQTPNHNYFMTFSVAADFSAPRVASPNETAEESQKLDQEFETHKKALQEKVAKEKELAPWTFVGESGWLNVVLRERSQLVLGPSATKEASLK
jgi:hypothetical protein